MHPVLEENVRISAQLGKYNFSNDNLRNFSQLLQNIYMHDTCLIFSDKHTDPIKEPALDKHLPKAFSFSISTQNF